MNQNQSPRPPRDERHPINNAMRVRTLFVLAFFLIFCLGLLIYQLYALQLRDPENYRVGAAEQQLSDQQIPATRGTIYDATGAVLARSTTVWNIIADPSACNEDFIDEAAEKLAELVGGDNTRSSVQLSDRESKYKVIARGVDLPTKDAVLEYANTKRALNEGDPRGRVGDRTRNLYRGKRHPQLSVRVVSVLGARLHQRRRRGHLRP